MLYSGIFKRFIPFLLTFAAGLIIAGIFVPLSAPSFNFPERGKRRSSQFKQMKTENERLRMENIRLKNLVNENEQSSETDDCPLMDVPPPPPMPPAPLEAPRRGRRSER